MSISCSMNTHQKYCISLMVIYWLAYLSPMMVSTRTSVTLKLKSAQSRIYGTIYLNNIGGNGSIKM